MTAAVPAKTSVASKVKGAQHKGRRRRAKRTVKHETYRGRERKEKTE